jgi:hydroxymethylbilane synthase
MDSLTIATRGSRLALWQAEYTAKLIRGRHPDLDVRMLTVKTTGDAVLDAPLAKIGGKGLFVREIDEALLAGRADLAVHSLKDIPMDLPDGLALGVVLQRDDPADLLLSVDYSGLVVLPSGATVGTSSLRRRAQILARRPDVHVLPLRGNIDSRLRKLQTGEFTAIVLAAAGVERLGMSAPHMERLMPERFVPAAGQGALGLEWRVDRRDIATLLNAFEHMPSRLCVEAERAFLAGMNGGCQTPIAAYATYERGGSLQLNGLIARLDGSEIFSRAVGGARPTLAAARQLGRRLAGDILDSGGRSVLNSALYEQE